MTTNEQEINELKRAICKLAEDNFNIAGKGLLLSQVGERLVYALPNFRKILGGRKLADFISKELAGSIHLLTSPENHIVKVILPGSVNIEGPIQQFLPEKDNQLNRTNTFRYSRAFWAAFTHPLSKGCYRVIKLNPVNFEDVEGKPTSEQEKMVIPASLIVPGSSEMSTVARDKQILDNITKWFELSEISPEAVSIRHEKTQENSRTDGHKSQTVLEALLSSLSDSDLKRIQMPLDIVAKLNSL